LRGSHDDDNNDDGKNMVRAGVVCTAPLYAGGGAGGEATGGGDAVNKNLMITKIALLKAGAITQIHSKLMQLGGILIIH
jgi:hypothetical protein